jgi:hypothetical protein
MGTVAHGLSHTCICKETDWYETKKVIDGGNVLTVSVGYVCLLHGICAEGWPQYSIEELCALIESDPKVNKAFIAVEHKVIGMLAKGIVWSDMTPASVVGRKSIGWRLEKKYAVISAAEFFCHFGVACTEVTGLRLIRDMINEEGQKFVGVLFEVHEVPKKLRSRKIVLYSDIGTMMTEEALPAHLNVRPQQATEQFNVSMASSLAQRDASLRLGSQLKFPAYTEVVANVACANEKKKLKEKADLEAAAAGRTGEDEDDDAVAGGGRRRQLTFGLPDEDESKKQKKAARVAPAKQRAAGSGPRGAKAAMPSTASAARSAMSARSAKGGPETPAKGSGGSVLRVSMDTGTNKKGRALEALDATADEALTLRTVYPSLDIDDVLRGSKLDRSLRGVPCSISNMVHVRLSSSKLCYGPQALCFSSPSPIQKKGPRHGCDLPPKTVCLEGSTQGEP